MTTPPKPPLDLPCTDPDTRDMLQRIMKDLPPKPTPPKP